MSEKKKITIGDGFRATMGFFLAQAVISVLGLVALSVFSYLSR